MRHSAFELLDIRDHVERSLRVVFVDFWGGPEDVGSEEGDGTSGCVIKQLVANIDELAKKITSNEVFRLICVSVQPKIR